MVKEIDGVETAERLGGPDVHGRFRGGTEETGVQVQGFQFVWVIGSYTLYTSINLEPITLF